jgi:hypothetical protein
LLCNPRFSDGFEGPDPKKKEGLTGEGRLNKCLLRLTVNRTLNIQQDDGLVSGIDGSPICLCDLGLKSTTGKDEQDRKTCDSE